MVTDSPPTVAQEEHGRVFIRRGKTLILGHVNFVFCFSVTLNLYGALLREWEPLVFRLLIQACGGTGTQVAHLFFLYFTEAFSLIWFHTSVFLLFCFFVFVLR